MREFLRNCSLVYVRFSLNQHLRFIFHVRVSFQQTYDVALIIGGVTMHWLEASHAKREFLWCSNRKERILLHMYDIRNGGAFSDPLKNYRNRGSV